MITKNQYSQKVMLLLVSLVGVLFFFNVPSIHADTSFLEKYASKVPAHTPVENLPDEIKKRLKVQLKSPEPYHNTYNYGQCTWYVYGRAKENGREYSQYEGDGGEWYLDKTSYGVKSGTTGGETPIPQTAVSMAKSYATLSGSYTTHVAYCEYIDSKGYSLITESNQDGGAPTGKVYARILTPDETSKTHLKYTVPLNKSSIKDWGKNPDGTEPANAPATGNTSNASTASDTSGTTATKSNLLPADNTFTVNGYGSIHSKDFQETVLSGNLPTAAMVNSLSSSQKQTLADWLADYDNGTDGTILNKIRTTISVVGFLLILYSLLLLLGYVIDRLGVLDFSVVSLITNSHYMTVTTKEEALDLRNDGNGVRGLSLYKLCIITSLAMIVFVLIATGQMYYYAYDLYYTVYHISDYMNQVRPQ